MIKIKIINPFDKVIKFIKAIGHSQSEEKPNTSCLAVSVLLRTYTETIYNNFGFESYSMKAEKEGIFEFKINMPVIVKSAIYNKLSFFEGINSFLLTGLKRIKQDFPDQIELEIVNG